MIALDLGFIAAALVVGAAIGGHCAALSSRKGRREDRATRDHAVEKALEWQALAAERATELAAVREELEAEQLLHHKARERATAEISQAERLPGWMQAAFLSLSGEVAFDDTVRPGPGYAA